MRIRAIPEAAARNVSSPGWLFLLTELAIFALVALPAQPPLTAALAEATLLVIVTAPILYYGWSRILRREREARVRHGQSVEAHALRDVTTGLPNRHGFHQCVGKEMER